jgi:hypothetical protein
VHRYRRSSHAKTSGSDVWVCTGYVCRDLLGMVWAGEAGVRFGDGSMGGEEAWFGIRGWLKV